MDLEALLGGGAGGAMAAPGADLPIQDTSETVQISSLALLKMLRHGRAGVPMEVMGLMLGEFVDDYTIRCVDVFAMPQSGTGVSVEAVDPVFQTRMLDMLKQTGRPEMVVGWYHSHPGFGPWLSSVDVNTQMSFEALNKRAVAVVIDPIQSVRGRVVIDAFRTIPNQSILMQTEPRQTTSNLGHLCKPSIVALIHGLNRHYYSMPIDYRKNAQEESMLRLVHQRSWTTSLQLPRPAQHSQSLERSMTALVKLAEAYSKSIADEVNLTPQQLQNRHVGRQDPKRHLKEQAESLISDSLVQTVGSSVSTMAF